MKKKTLLFVAMLCAFALSGLNKVQAQDSPLYGGADIVSRYIWRGVNLGGGAPSIQPYVGLSLLDGKVDIGAWGAYATVFDASGNVTPETDLYVTVTPVDAFSVTLTDYFFAGGVGGGSNYFYYKQDMADMTGHTFETALSFNGTESVPVSLTFAMNIYGFDAPKYGEDDPESDAIQMSKYLELGYSTDVQGVALDVFMGMALDDPDEDKGEWGFYGQESMGVINLGATASKEIEITDKFSLPVFSSLIYNPEREDMFIVFGLSL